MELTGWVWGLQTGTEILQFHKISWSFWGVTAVTRKWWVTAATRKWWLIAATRKWWLIAVTRSGELLQWQENGDLLQWQENGDLLQRQENDELLQWQEKEKGITCCYLCWRLCYLLHCDSSTVLHYFRVISCSNSGLSSATGWRISPSTPSIPLATFP